MAEIIIVEPKKKGTHKSTYKEHGCVYVIFGVADSSKREVRGALIGEGYPMCHDFILAGIGQVMGLWIDISAEF